MSELRDPLALVGTTIDGKYRIDRVIGEGGFGVVYAAEHLLLKTAIAVKCLKPFGSTSADEERSSELFLREARVLFSLTHPNIVRLYDLGTVASGAHRVPYVVLELLVGRSLEDEIRRRAEAGCEHFTARELAGIFEPVLAALSLAHARGITHRDLKPSNVMLVEEAGVRTAKVVDFGIARWSGEQKHSTGATGFTPRYAAPEQWDATLGAPGPATDVFSFGLLLAEACLLRPVFDSASATQILAALMNPARRIEIRALRPDLPVEIERLIDRATRIDAGQRYPDAAALLVDLRAALAAAVSPEPIRVPISGDSARLSLPTAQTERAVSSTHREVDAALLRPVTAPRRPVGFGLRVVLGILSLALVAGFVALSSSGRAPSKSPPPSSSAPATLSSASASSSTAPFERAMVKPSLLFAGNAYSEEVVSRLVNEHAAEVRGCYLDALGRNASVSGEMTVLVAVEFTGKVFGGVPDLDEGRIDWNAIKDVTLRACVRDKIGAWIFPKHGKTQDVTGLVMTFEFRRADEPSPAFPADAGVASFAGQYDTLAILTSSKAEYPSPATIVQRGPRLAVDYPDGTMACHVEGDRLSCLWIQSDNNGRATLVRKSNGGLVGTWGYSASDSNAGPWTFTKRK